MKNADTSVLVRFAYTRDAAGNPIAIERESGLGVYYYEYDALQRLAYEGQFVDAAREYENYYEYDAAGNRTLLRHGETDAEDLTYYEYNEANELLQLPTTRTAGPTSPTTPTATRSRSRGRPTRATTTGTAGT